MLIYNITTKVEWSVADNWVQWMKDLHIPEVLSTGCFSSYQFVRLLGNDDDEGATYAVQYYVTQRSDYVNYIEHFADNLKNKALRKWGDKFISFSSLMEVISQDIKNI